MPLSAHFEWTALLLLSVSVGSLFWYADPLLKTGQVAVSSSPAVLLAERFWIEDGLIEKVHPGWRVPGPFPTN